MNMPQEIEEQTDRPFDLGSYLDVVRRRHLQFLIPLFVAWLAIWGSSWFLAPRYKSSTLILVEQPTMPRNYVVPNVNDDLQERLQSIEQQILSRTRLLLIINKLNLYTDKRHALSPDEKVQRMRKDVDIELVREPQNDAITAFRVSFSAPDSRIAQQVVGELTSLFIDENSRVREQESEDTTQFIQNQLASARSSLADQEAKVRAFQAVHEGALPSQEASNLQILSGLQAQLQNEQDALSTARQHSVYTQSLIDQYRNVEATGGTVTGTPTGLGGVNQQLDTLEAKLADLKTRYTDEFPEVRAVKQEIASKEKEKQQLLTKLKSEGDDPGHQADSEASASINSLQSGPALQLQSQLKSDAIEIANREQAITTLKSRINDYQARLGAEPAVEQQLADLTRGYEQSQVNYNDLLKKENDSQMATSMEQMQEGERFTMLDPPSLPVKPDFPNRLKMCGTGLGVGFVLGLLVVVGLEFLDDRMHSEVEIQKLLPVAVISEIPEVVTQSDLRSNKIRMTAGWATAAIVLLTILAGSAVSYLHN
jgi:polysaccharide chain length determinant protein (PEP-CTERM system associated)